MSIEIAKIFVAVHKNFYAYSKRGEASLPSSPYQGEGFSNLTPLVPLSFKGEGLRPSY